MGELAKLSVCDVRQAVPAGPGVEAGLVVLREDSPPERLLRIVIGQPEARAIHVAWAGTVALRPSTWDLFVSSVALLDGRIERAIITAVEDRRHFFAAIELRHGEDLMRLDCRASDAIALALRSPGAEILAEEQVLANAGIADGAPPP